MKPKFLRLYFCLFALLLIFTTNGVAQMRQVYIDNVAENEIYKTSFYSSSEGYVAFRDWIGYTTDSGRTFTRKAITLSNVDYSGYGVNLTFGFAINGVKAFDRNTIFVYGHYGFVPAILSSTNGGNTFKLVFHSQFNQIPNGGIEDMIFPQNSSTGYAVDADRILKTIDRGLTWTAIRTDPKSNFKSLSAADDNVVIALCTGYTSNKLLKTVNAGNSWQIVDFPVLKVGKMTSAFFLTANTGWLSIYDDDNISYVYKTINGGINWSLQNYPKAVSVSCSKMKFLDNNNGYALSGQNTIVKTSDGGKIWEPLLRDNDFVYLGYTHNDLQIFSATQLWAGGGHGLLEMSNNGGGNPLPRAYFDVDTTGSFNSGTVKLVNYSRTIYSYKWLLNGAQISTSFNSSYLHDRTRIKDTIALVVSNGTRSDTAVKYQSFEPPVGISSFSPTTGARGTVITINGTNFTGASIVTFGGVAAANFSVVSPTTIRATVGAGGSGFVKISKLSGTDSLAGFTFLPAPVISSFAPLSAQAGTVVTLKGAYFSGATAVSFGGIPATSFQVMSDTTITAIVPSGGSGSVSVISPGGSALLAGYIALPRITSFTPKSGTVGTKMTITGTSLTGINSVTVGGLDAQSFVINSSTSVTAIVSAGATGQVVVSKPGGTASDSGFTWFASPVITSFSPVSGPVGTEVTIRGSGFNNGPANNTVYFGAVKAVVKASSDNVLVVAVPAGANFQPVTVTSNNLTTYSAQPFLVTFANGGSITAGSFATRTTIGMGDNGPMDVLLGDLDGDGRSDLIVTKSGVYVSESGVFLYRNTSIGAAVSFAAPVALSNLDYKGTAIGDLDGDGKIDLSVITDAGIATFRNVSSPGTISFSPSALVPTGIAPTGISINDLDGDGKPDIATSSSHAGTATVFRNTSNPGDISFATSVNYSVSDGGRILLIDLDADNKPEMVIHSLTYERFYVLKNNCGKGSILFDAPRIFNSYLSYSIASGDIDQDGKPDLISGSYNGSKLVVFRNTTQSGSISFAPATELSTSFSPVGISIGDLDGDGKPDIASAIEDQELTLVKNTSTPGNIIFSKSIDFNPSTIRGGHNVAVGDINNDGKNDVVVIAEGKRQISIYINSVTAQPTITSFSPTIGISGTTINIQGENFTGVSSVSFGGVPAASFIVNSSTSISAVAGVGASGNVAVTNGLGTGTRPGFVFGLPPVINSISPLRAGIGETVTITGNNFTSGITGNIVFFGGVRAVVTAASSTSITAIVPVGATDDPVTVTTDSRTAFSSQLFSVKAPMTSALSFVKELKTAGFGNGTLSDIDGDGKLDIVSAHSASEISVARNTSTPGNISFAPVIRFSTGAQPLGIVISDLNGDGKPDIIVYNYESQSISVLRNMSMAGTVSLGAAQNYLTGPSTTRPVDATINDLDGDGKPEIIVANYYSRNISVFKNESSGGNISLAQRVDYGLTGYPTGIIARDIDGNGKPELLVSVNATNAIAVFPNLSLPGNIILGKENYQSAGAWPDHIEVADIDGDDKTDMLLPNANSNNISVFKNQSSIGNIGIDTKQDINVGNGTKNISLGDLDGDGKVDIVNLDFYPGKMLSILKNTSVPGMVSVSKHSEYQVGENSISSSVGDIDGDGLADIVIHSYDYSMTFLRNISGAVSTITLCPNAGTTLSSNLSGVKFQWQQNTGNGFINIADNQNFTGTTASVLQLKNIPATFNNYEFRCVADGSQSSQLFRISLQAAVVPTVTIRTNDANVCAGNNITYTGIVSNEGSAPVYQWKKNGLNVGTNSPSYSSSTFANGDLILLTLTSNATCADPAMVISVRDTVKINPMVVPAVTVTGISVVNPGQSTQLSAMIFNGGTAPVCQWQDSTTSGWQNIAGATSRILVYTPTISGVKVRCMITGNAPCTIQPTAVSNSIMISVNTVTGIVPVPAEDRNVKFYPNPVNANLTISNLDPTDRWNRLEITNLKGNQVLMRDNLLNQRTAEINVSRLSAGVYVAKIFSIRPGVVIYFRFIKF